MLIHSEQTPFFFLPKIVMNSTTPKVISIEEGLTKLEEEIEYSLGFNLPTNSIKTLRGIFKVLKSLINSTYVLFSFPQYR